MDDLLNVTNPKPSPEPPVETPVDAGSQALAEALRSSFAIVKFVMVILILVFLGSGFFVVGPQEQAILLRFGKPMGEGQKALLGPGLHFSLPYPIDENIKVSISGIQQVKSTVGWFATTPEMELANTEPPAGPSLNPTVDGYVLTADGNIVHSRATLTYRVSDPVRYELGFMNATNSIQNALDDALLWAAARYGVDDILTRDVLGFSEAVKRRVVQLAEERNLGITVEQCPVQSIPPRQVKDAFNSVVKADQARGKVLNDARTSEIQILSRASADATSRTNLAESDRVRLVNEVSSRAAQFRDLLPKYQANPILFEQQRRLETFSRVLTNVQDKIFIPVSADGTQKELRLLLNREPPKPKTEEQKP